MSQNYLVKPRKSDLAKSQEELLTALISGNQPLATRLVDDAIDLRWEPSFVYIHLIGYCLTEIGTRWHAGALDISIEHRATQMALRFLSKAQTAYINERRIGRSAIITSVEGDNHVIGGLTFADLLRFEGWDVDFLGADSPVDSIIELATKESPDLVGLSVTTEQFVSNAVATADGLKNLPAPPVVVVGGAAATSDLISAADFCSTDAIEVIGWTQAHFNLDESSMSTEVMLVELGVRIQSLRKDRGLSQQGLAADAGLDRSYVSAIEHGKQNVSFATLKGISDALGVGVSDLITG